MKNILLLAGILFIISCGNTSNKNNSDADTSSADEEMQLEPEEKLVWITQYDTAKAEFHLVQQRQINADSLQPQDMVQVLNDAWKDVNVTLEFKKISHDTLYVNIPQAEYLTERMGSSGAMEYLASTTYNLTEVKNIRFVNYTFKAGDHLSPGTYTRDDFNDFH